MIISGLDLNSSVQEIMTRNITSVMPNTLVSIVDEYFKNNDFHHIPVLDESGKAVGMVSRSDYHKLQHHFTLFNYKEAVRSNEKLFDSLVAEDIMVKDPVTVHYGTSIREVLKMFKRNEFHSVLVTEKGKCIGIVTPYDFLEILMND